MAHRITDHRRHQLNLTDVRALLRLCNELHGGSPDPQARKQRLLEGLRRLTGADHASAAVAVFASRRGAGGAPPAIISLTHAPVTPPAHAGGADSVWAAYERVRPRGRRHRAAADGPPPVDFCTASPASRAASRRSGGVGHHVHSFLPLADGLVACLTVARAPGAERFSSRDRSMVCALHAEVAWVYGADLIHVSPETRELSPRQLEVLTHLLTAKSEKEIAAGLAVSYNTLHHYVKGLFRHLGVSSRVELLARWVGK